MSRKYWKKIVDNHRDDDSHAICDACLVLPDVYDQLVELEAKRDYRERFDAERVAVILAELEGVPCTPSLKNRDIAGLIIARLTEKGA